MGAMTATVDTDTARGLLMLNPLLMPRPSPRLMPPQLPTTAMAALVVMEDMVATDTARGPLMLMPTTAMVVMEAMADTDTVRGLLMPMPTTAMAAMEVMEAMAEYMLGCHTSATGSMLINHKSFNILS